MRDLIRKDHQHLKKVEEELVNWMMAVADRIDLDSSSGFKASTEHADFLGILNSLLKYLDSSKEKMKLYHKLCSKKYPQKEQ